MQARSEARSDVGRVRKQNQDRLLRDDEATVYAVADGVGGHAAGERAAERLLATVGAAIADLNQLGNGYDGNFEALRTAGLARIDKIFQAASESLYQEAQSDPALRGMATTGIIVWLVEGHGLIGHVGDSRVYLVRGGRAARLTTDHTIGQSLLDQGAITSEQAGTLVYRDVLARAVGVLPQCQTDLLCIDLQKGDRLVLCTDGLTRHVDDDRLAALAVAGGSTALVDAALTAGGEDNVTAIVTEVLTTGDQAAVLPTTERVRVLKDHFLFRYLTYQELLRTLTIVREERFAVGQYVFREGEPGDRIYSVVTGSPEVRKDGVRLTRLEAGAGFGEIAFTDSRPRSADVVAVTEATVLSIQRDDFQALTREDAPVAWKLLWCFVLNLADRLRILSDDFVTGANDR